VLRRLFGVELEEVGDDFGFGRVGREAVGGNALAARCTSGAGGSPRTARPTVPPPQPLVPRRNITARNGQFWQKGCLLPRTVHNAAA